MATVNIRLDYWQILAVVHSEAAKLADPHGKMSHADTIRTLNTLDMLNDALSQAWDAIHP